MCPDCPSVNCPCHACPSSWAVLATPPACSTLCPQGPNPARPAGQQDPERGRVLGASSDHRVLGAAWPLSAPRPLLSPLQTAFQKPHCLASFPGCLGRGEGGTPSLGAPGDNSQESPRNLGACLREAPAEGLAGHLSCPDPPPPTSPAGRSLDVNPEALRIFEEFVESKGLSKTEIASHPHISNRDAPPPISLQPAPQPRGLGAPVRL